MQRTSLSLSFVTRPCPPWSSISRRRKLVMTKSVVASLPASSISSDPLRLRHYQEECIQSVLSHLNRGYRRLGVSLATGSGKTIIFTQLIDRVSAQSAGSTQTLILVHRRELVEQAARHCMNAYPSKSVEVEMGNNHASGAADITVASIWTLVSGNRIAKFNPKKFKLVLVDEAHHIVAPSFMSTLKYFGLLRENMDAKSPALVGVSATLSRFDGLRLSDAIDYIVYHKDYVDMIEEKWLSNVIFTTVKSKADISWVKKNTSCDFQVGDLSKAVNNEQTNDITVNTWISRASSRKSTLIFCVDLAHITDLSAAFRRRGIDARYVTGGTSRQIRSARLDAFKNREYPVLMNCGVFTEGTDMPNIDCIVLARPTRSRNLLTQMIGRGMRLYPGKENCHVIDMVASLNTGIITCPTLFGLDPATLVNEADIKDMKSLKLEREREDPEATHEKLTLSHSAQIVPNPHSNPIVTFTEYDSVYDLIDDTSGERHIRSMSPLAWVMIRPDRFVLSSQSGSYITIQKSPEKLATDFHVIYMQKLPQTKDSVESRAKSPYMRPREIARSETLSEAVHAADTFALQKFSWHFVHQGQAWRKAPATKGQLAFLNRLRPMTQQLTESTITKGKATDMISKIKFGAKGHFSKLEGMKRKGQQMMEKLREDEVLKQRETVEVGPVPSGRK